MADEDINISSGWNGIIYTAHASDGVKFGTGSSLNEDEAKAEAVKDLKSKNATTEAPVTGGGTGAGGQAAAVAAGRTGDTQK